MFKACALFVIGLVLLIFAGDWFVDGATSVAKKFRIPDLLIGATVVSIGTTLPEVCVSATGALQGHAAIAYGNAIGSIICNTSLIAAISIAVKPSYVNRDTLKVPVAFFFGSLVFYTLGALLDGYFTRSEGLILLVIFLIYIAIQAGDALGYRIFKKKDEVKVEPNIAEAQANEERISKAIAMLIVGAAGIAFGANLLVDNGTIIAEALGVPETVIALTFVALGTSLPELVTAITSLVKGHGLLSLGNIIGANLFNLVLVSGLSITLSPFAVPAEKTIAGLNASFVVDIPLAFLVMIVLTIPTLFKGKLHRWQGILLLALYATYCVFQFAF